MATMSERFFSTRIALEAPSFAIFRVAVNGYSIDAAPTFFLRLTVSERFFFALIARSIVLETLGLRRVEDLAMNTAPTIARRRTMLERFLFGRIAFVRYLNRVRCVAISRGFVDDLPVDAAPTPAWFGGRRRWRWIICRRRRRPDRCE